MPSPTGEVRHGRRGGRPDVRMLGGYSSSHHAIVWMVFMHPIASLFSILGALALGAISPGPSFLFVTRTAVAVSRPAGIMAAAGMGLGAALISALALLGVRAVVSQAEWLYLGFKLLGGGYLCYLAWRLWSGARDVTADTAIQSTSPPPVSPGRSFWLALATQLSNPKTLLVIGGIFAALLPARIPVWMYIAIPVIQLFMESCWYTFVAVAMSSARPRRVYLQARGQIDRAAGCVLGVLGLRLLCEGATGAV
jgi:threonine/homoserine/homoserine lactone efflux protein